MLTFHLLKLEPEIFHIKRNLKLSFLHSHQKTLIIKEEDKQIINNLDKNKG